MKKPANLPVAGALALPCLCLFLTNARATEIWPAIYESYDKNPLGEMVGQPSGGYGVTGVYNSQGGSEAASRLAFQIIQGGLEFGSLSTVTSTSRCVQVDASATGCGVGIQVDGGKAWGDTDMFYYDKLYCSYLIRFQNISNNNAARAEVRTSTAASGGTNFQVNADYAAIAQTTPPALLTPLPVDTPASTNPTVAARQTTAAGLYTAQPALAYTGNATSDYTRVAQNPVDNSLIEGTTYLMLGRFNSAGNQLSFVLSNVTWTPGSNIITLAGTSSSIAPGQLVTGTGIAEDSVVTGVNGTAVTLSKPTVSGGSATTLDFRGIVARYYSTNVLYNHTTAPRVVTLNDSTASIGKITVGMYLTPSTTGIPVNARVVSVNSSGGFITSVIIDQDLTATSSSRSVTFRDVSPLTATWTSGQSVITVSSDPGIQIGQVVVGTGIPTGTFVTNISGTQVTLNQATTQAGSSTSVHFYLRSGTSSMYALTLAQYNNFLASGSDETTRLNYLNNTTIGRAANQISVRIIGKPATSGSIEFGHGRYIHLVAQGASGSNQKYLMDELRYGFTLRSVTQPSTFESVPSGDPVAFDGFTGDLDEYFPHESGYGWKSGYYEVEETAATQGAYIIPNKSGAPMVPSGGNYGIVFTRTAISADQGVRRRPDPAVVDMTKPYTVSFDYQVTGGDSTFTQFADRIQIGADVQVAAGGALTQSVNLGPNPTRPGLTASPITAGTAINWMIGVVGADESAARPVYPRRWYFYDYTGASLSDAGVNFFVKENMVLASDDAGTDPDNDEIPSIGSGIYSFKIEVNPLTFTYRATVYYRLTTTSAISAKFSKGGLRFRDNVAADSFFWGISKGTSELRSFGLDNIRVSPGVDYFPDWVASYPAITVAGDKVRTADPDKDGKVNFLEYAMDGNPTSGSTGGKTISGVTTISSSNYHALTVPIRSHFTFSPSGTGPLVSSFTNNEGLRYRIEGSYDLVNWNAEVVQLSSALASTPALTDASYAYRSFRLAQPISTTNPKGFIRVKVETTK